MIFHNLGSTPERPGATLIQAGSVLDDYQWHDLAIIRYNKNITVKIDQAMVNDESQSAFNGLDLDGKVSNKRSRFSLDRSNLLFSFTSVAHQTIWNVALLFDLIFKVVWKMSCT